MLSTLPDRFWSKVNKTDHCWLWTGSVNNKGYGKISIQRSVWALATRAAWFLYYGVWPTKGMLHTCDTPRCVRKEHLFEGDQKTNMQDCSRKGRTRSNPAAAWKTRYARYGAAGRRTAVSH